MNKFIIFLNFNFNLMNCLKSSNEPTILISTVDALSSSLTFIYLNKPECLRTNSSLILQSSATYKIRNLPKITGFVIKYVYLFQYILTHTATYLHDLLISVTFYNLI